MGGKVPEKYRRDGNQVVEVATMSVFIADMSNLSEAQINVIMFTLNAENEQKETEE